MTAIIIALVWLVTIISFLLGAILGYWIGTGKMEEKIAKVKQGMRRKEPKESGPVLPYTPEEKKNLDTPESQKFKELLQ